MIRILPYGSEAILRPESKRPNITKDAPIALLAQRIPRVWGTVSQEPGMKTKIHIYCKSQYHMSVLKKKSRGNFEDSKCEK